MLEVDVEVDRRDFAVRASLNVAPGERLALFGPSGAGKTTLLEVIAGLVAARRARVMLAGRLLTSTVKPVTAVPPWQRNVGLLRQDPGLFPHLSVRSNLLYAQSASAHRAELPELAAVLGIDRLLGAMPARLSGGQAHRVALGRLLLSHCDALLLDEPYTGLDAGLRRTLTELVVSLVAQRRVPSMLVAHELAEAQAFADQLAVIDRGVVLQVGPPSDVVLRPALRRVAELVGYTAFVPMRAPGSAVAAIHPDRVVLGAQPDRGLVLNGYVTQCRPSGALWEVTVQAGADVIARLPDPAAVGADLVITATDPPIFAQDGTAAPIPGRGVRVTGAGSPRDGQAVADQPGPGRDGHAVADQPGTGPAGQAGARG